MADLNSVALCGRLGADPELRHTADGTPVVNMRIAVNGIREGETSWFTVVAFQKTAELAAQYLTKGRQVNLHGRLQERRWVAQDGTNRSVVEVVANQVQFLGGPREDREPTVQSRGSDWPEPPPTPPPTATGRDPFPAPAPGPRRGDEDIPFLPSRV